MTEKSTPSFSFVETEHKILKFWEENQIFEKSLEQTKSNAPYIFYDGPPFATGLPHHGHLVGAVLKDIVPRYFTMKGRYITRRFGWDCHGVPIEHEIDKKLGMNASEAVEKLGVKAYNDECRGIVQRYTKEWEKTVNRIGRWVDFENDYKTMDVDFMESVWWVFKQLWDKDLIYQGTKVVPFSTALGTVLSNFEAGSNYQDVQDPAVTVLFPVKGQDFSIAAWTTTPWTLPSNLGLCVGPEITYVKVQSDSGKKFVLAKDRLETYQKKHELEVLEELKASDLVGLEYTPLFSYFESLRAHGAFRIHSDDYVTTSDGTGIVHLAPAFGEDDNRVLKTAGMSEVVCPIDNAGCFTAEVSDYTGEYIKEADKKIIKRLKEEGKLFEQGVLVHSYPFCPRSDTPLIYRTIPSWYVKVEQMIPDLIKSNEQINWVPENIKEGRFGKWLEGARDWAISRNRVWGTPLPIWINDKTENAICLGSRADIEKYTGVKVDDLHREHVDQLEFTVDGEEGVYKRIPEVLDCWFESGSMPYAQLHFPFENKEVFEKGFPAEYIAEGLDQTRGWFYTLTVLSTALYGKPAFKNVIVNGIVAAEDGKKMSKRLRNYTPPSDLMEEYGADALRLYLINSGLVRAQEQRFSDAGVKDMARRALLPWFNAFKFFQTYADVDGWKPGTHFKKGENITDHWILSRLQTLKQNIEKEMSLYHLYNVVPALFEFIEDLTNWYIRLNRSRFWGDGLSDDKCSAYSTLYTALKELSTAMAPFAPFLSEFVFGELKKLGGIEAQSVHLEKYPVANTSMIRPELEDAVQRMQQIILLGRQVRNQSKIKVKTPLARVSIIHKDQGTLDEISKLETYLKGELNIKNVEYSQDESNFIKLFAKPNSPVLGKRLGKNFGKYRGLIQNLRAEDLEKLEREGKIQLDEEFFTPDDILIFREAQAGKEGVASNRFISIELDLKLSEELKREGLAREIVNRIQKTRKDQDLNVSDRIHVTYHADAVLSEAFSSFHDYISKETLTQKLTLSESPQPIDFKIDGHTMTLNIEVVSS